MSRITSMKSKFAKFIDGTLGAALIFFAAVAVLRYFIPATDLTVFCALSITACVCLLAKLRGRKNGEKVRISKAADDMFFEFMFLPQNVPAKLLAAGLKSRGENAATHGSGVYVGKTAAYCVFGQSDESAAARLIAKAKHYGANKLVILCKAPPPVPQVDGMDIKLVCGDDVYKLFASLNALPQKKYAEQNTSRRSAFKNAFSPDKIIRYVLLAVAFFFVARFSRSIITFACAVLCAALAVIGITIAVVRKAKKRKTN